MPTDATGHATGEHVPVRSMLTVARALAAAPDHSLIGRRLSTGHRSGGDGLCRHPAHRHRPETHPCSIVRVVTLVERLTDPAAG